MDSGINNEKQSKYNVRLQKWKREMRALKCKLTN
jgi:hypothetical protein